MYIQFYLPHYLVSRIRGFNLCNRGTKRDGFPHQKSTFAGGRVAMAHETSYPPHYHGRTSLRENILFYVQLVFGHIEVYLFF
jgi:hypothetical protein